ncbi:EthD domain-containing protein [Aspergillus pseudodeflectus]|uniref:EthD domain-containing protein n=1 Tax=Aspergillus pseudodeflectus TaxID=176178 RepID=A0ABR4JCU8_9EURO
MASNKISKFTLLKRRRDLTRDEYNNHWHTTHAQILASSPAFWRYTESYVQNHVLPIPAALAHGPEPPFDGVAKTYQKPRDDLVKDDFFNDPSYLTVVRQDELNFLSVYECTTLYNMEHIVKDGPRSGVKYLSFLRRAEGLDHEQFLEYWIHRHAALVKIVKPFYSLVRRYVQHHGRLDLHRPMAGEGKPETFDGVVELYFDSVDDLEKAYTHPEYLAILRPDEARFIKGPSMRFVVEERPVNKAKSGGS